MPSSPIDPGLGSALWWCLALLFVLGLAWAARHLAQRHGLGPMRKSGRIALQETIALDTKRRVHLIRCDQRFLLLETGGVQDVMLGWLPPAEPPP